MLALTGTAFFASSCKDSFLGEISPSPIELGVDVSELKNWFENVYLKKSLRHSGEEKSKRNMNWEQTASIMHNLEEFYWVPIDYNGHTQGMSILTYKEGDDFALNMAEYLSLPLTEGFLISKKEKKKGDYEGFIVQIAFDPLYNKAGARLDLKNYTGRVIHTDWNNEMLRFWDFKNGKLLGDFDREMAAKSRQTCTTYYYSYNEVTGQSCGPGCEEVYYTLHTVPKVFCYNEEGWGYPGSSDFGSYPSGGSVTSYNPYGPDPATWSPTDYRRSLGYLNSDPTQRPILEQKMNDAIQGIGLAYGFHNFSISKAKAMARTLGIPVEEVKILTEGPASKFLGRVVFITDLYALGVAIGENGANIDQYDADDAAALLGVVGIFLTGWWAVGAAGLAIGFTIYELRG